MVWGFGGFRVQGLKWFRIWGVDRGSIGYRHNGVYNVDVCVGLRA